MRHRVKSKRIHRPGHERTALLANLAVSIILYEKVKTTKAKAQLVKPIVEKLITVAKKKDKMNALRYFESFLPDPNAFRKLIEVLRERYKKRSSGFLRLIPAGFRRGDAAAVTYIELV